MLDLLLYFGAIVVIMVAQVGVQNAFRKYRNIPTVNGITGAEVAQKILDQEGITSTRIILSTAGELSDNYNPKTDTVSLSPDIANSSSIAAVAVAAHEVGHVIQHHKGYKMIDVRNAILPSAIIAGKLSWAVIVLGFLFSRVVPYLLWVGIAMLGVVALFQFVTLPVELNASSRALKILTTGGYITSEETGDASKMLRAAAFTYVAGLIGTLAQILRLILISNRRNN